jgi:F0F1-type ATP synthase membrane subunit b/b'
MDNYNQKSLELWGKKFRIVESGLDRDDVISFVNSLVEKNRELTIQFEYIDSLKKLAERITVEAAKLAEETLAKTEERRRDIISEAVKQAEQEAQAAKYEAEKSLQRNLKTAEDKIKEKLRQFFEGVDFNFDFAFRETAEIITTENKKEIKTAEGMFQECKPPIASQVYTVSSEKEREPVIANREERQPVTEISDKHILSGEKKDDSSSFYEGMIELLIPELIGLDHVFRLHKSLKGIPNMKVMNFKVANDRKSVIVRLFLESPIPLLQVLAGLPEIQSVSKPLQQDVQGKAHGDNSNTRRILVTTRN